MTRKQMNFKLQTFEIFLGLYVCDHHKWCAILIEYLFNYLWNEYTRHPLTIYIHLLFTITIYIHLFFYSYYLQLLETIANTNDILKGWLTFFLIFLSMRSSEIRKCNAFKSFVYYEYLKQVGLKYLLPV